jgi:hypothetical protein
MSEKKEITKELPTDIIESILHFCPHNDLVNASLINKQWKEAAQRDSLWYKPLQRAYQKEKQQELDLVYQSKIKRMAIYELKKKGVPVPPPPRQELKPITEKSDYRKHYINIMKRLKDEKYQIERRERIEEKERKFGNTLHNISYQISIFFSTCIYICMFAGFIMRSLAHENVVKPFVNELRTLIYIPWWLMWIFVFMFLAFFYLRWWYDQPRSRDILPLSLISQLQRESFFVLCFLTEAVLPLNLTDPQKPRVVISYHFVFIPLHLGLGIVTIIDIIWVVVSCMRYWKSGE